MTGKAAYGADISLPGMLYGAMLRSPHAHARIIAIDTSRAEAHPDVKAVATSADLALGSERLTEVGEDVVTTTKYLSNNVLAADKVLYKGHAVAAIAASSPHVAEEALSLIDVTYEALPSVTTAEEAMKPDAPILHDHLVAPSYGDEPPSKSNIAQHQQFRLGDVEQGFAEADLALEREFRTKSVHQGYIEPQNGTAWWAHDGHLTIWCSSQGHFGIRDNTAKVLGLDVSSVTVVPMEIGGGFGGKLPTYLEPVAAVLSKKSGRPVKMTMNRAEVLEATGPTSGTYIRLKMGVTNEGRITAAQAYLAYEAGRLPRRAHRRGGGVHVRAVQHPERAGGRLRRGHEQAQDRGVPGAGRAHGRVRRRDGGGRGVRDAGHRAAGVPAAQRRAGGDAPGGRRAEPSHRLHGDGGGDDGAPALLGAAGRAEPGPRASPRASGGTTPGPSSVFATVQSDGTISLVEGSVDIGGSRAAIAQQFAEVLGIPAEDVNPHVADTDHIGYTSLTGGSGVTFKTGWAAHDAAQDVVRQLRERAALLWETTADQVEYRGGALYRKGDPGMTTTLKELAGRLNELGGPVVGRASVNPRGVGPSFSATMVDVEVDPETGKVQVLRCTAFQDAGRAIHPDYVEGQIQGGTVQGIGWALNEEYVMSDDGRLLNASLLDYRMPTSLDVPMVDAVIVEVPNPGHPFGVRGVGEASIVPPMAAVANAIHAATGVRMRQLPMSPGRVLEGIWARDGGA